MSADRFFELSRDLMCVADFDGHLVKLNEAWERVLGFTRAELMSKPMFEFIHPDDRERTLGQNRQVRIGGTAIEFENRYRCRDGSYRWLRWNSIADTERRRIYAVARDITERREADADRDDLLRRLRAALAEVRELRGVLPICMYCRKIRDDETWQTIETYIGTHTNSSFSHGICPDCYGRFAAPGADGPDDPKKP